MFGQGAWNCAPAFRKPHDLIIPPGVALHGVPSKPLPSFPRDPAVLSGRQLVPPESRSLFREAGRDEDRRREITARQLLNTRNQRAPVGVVEGDGDARKLRIVRRFENVAEGDDLVTVRDDVEMFTEAPLGDVKGTLSHDSLSLGHDVVIPEDEHRPPEATS